MLLPFEEAVLNTFFIILVCLVSAQLTHWSIHKLKTGAVRVSGATTLLFVGLVTLLNIPNKEVLAAAFLGSSFLGMSDRDILTSRDLFFASWIFAILFLFVLPFNIGLGGALGTAAFSSCLIIREGRELAKKLKRS